MPAGHRDPAVAALYDAVGNDEALVTALADLRTPLKARTMVLVTAQAGLRGMSRHIASAGVPHESLVAYENHFHVHDVWVQAGRRRGLLQPGMVVCSDTLLPRAELEASYFWRAFLSRFGTTDALSALIEAPPEAPAFTFITFHRGVGDLPFGDAEVAVVKAWLPHITTVLTQQRRLLPALSFARSLDQIIQSCLTPVFSLNADADVVSGNPAFQARLTSLDATHWREQLLACRGWLAGAAPTCRVMVPGAQGGGAFRLDLFRLQQGFFDAESLNNPVAMGMLERADPLESADWAQRFALTPAQTRVAQMLLQGLSPAEVATVLDLSTHTVRSHIRALFEKTQVRRMPALLTRLTHHS